MRRTTLPTLLLLLLTGRAAGQGTSVATLPVSARDSAQAARAARSEQSRFELVRRHNLPWTDHGGGVCEPQDERIGRFCLSFSDSDEEWVPPPEDARIAAARDRLIERLDSVARLIPGDAWVAGQRVRYLVEARRFDAAEAAARQCRARAWWCHALRGYARHYAGRAAEADSAFEAMLQAMPADERRRWTDLSMILDGCSLRSYRRVRDDDPARAAWERRFWRLADPFLARPGNDLRSEHMARHLMDALQDRAKSTENLSWGNDLREILVRYGSPIGWERIRPRFGSADPPSMVSHYSNTEQRLLPPCEAVDAAADLTAGSWDQEERRPQAGYSLPLADSTARWIYPLDHQAAVFRRGDSAVVVAAYALPRDSIPAGTTIQAGLALVRDGDGEPVLATASTDSVQGALRATVAPGAVLLSLELVAERARRAARARRGLAVPPRDPGRLAVSDLLLLRSPEALPDSLDAAVPAARGSNRVDPGEQLGLFWEVYGLRGDGPDLLTMSIRLLDERRGLVRRMAERAGILRASEPIRMRWQEPTAAATLAARALVVQIPPELDPGIYTLELTVERIGEEAAVARREIQVTDPAAR